MTINTIDTAFDVYSDTPIGKDPDSHSRMLRQFHRALWSKQLPSGDLFTLSADQAKGYLHHRSDRGEFILSSDSIGHTYRNVKSMAQIIAAVPDAEIDRFFSVCSTVGAYIVFPSQRVDNMMTINGARGTNARIKDRFDLTLECIRRHYMRQASPLDSVLARYHDFFALFDSFGGYVEFFLLQDLVREDGETINFFLPFAGFETPPLPANVDEYQSYRESVIAFVNARNDRIESQTS